jgi:hypothetical protein
MQPPLWPYKLPLESGNLQFLLLANITQASGLSFGALGASTGPGGTHLNV